MNDTCKESNEVPGELETGDYLHGVKSSTCLLLPMATTPSPLDLKHPLSEELSEGPFITLNDDDKMLETSGEGSGGDSSSSADSNSVVHDPISAQLINNISMLDYQSLGKNGDVILAQPEICKLNGNLNVTNRKLPNFVNWNWPLIRKILLWFVLSGLIACLGAIISMVITIPKTCNPDLPWHQGKVFYEIFPAKFKDSNKDGIGDLKGLIEKLDYIKNLGGSAIRLNYIFEAYYYPDYYYNTSSLMHIDMSIGDLKDFQDLVAKAHNEDLSVILDIPVLSMAELVIPKNVNHSFEFSNDVNSDLDATTAAIVFWARVQNVDGFYLKNIEKFVDDDNFGKSLQLWKQILGNDKILIASDAAFNNVKDINRQVFLNRIDLVDVHLDMKNGINELKNHINDVVSGSLWEKPHYPWVHWNIGNVNSERISTKHVNNTLTLTALELILPGTVSIFYGDEIGLAESVYEAKSEIHDHKHSQHNLVPMVFSEKDEFESDLIVDSDKKSVIQTQYHLDAIKSLIELRLNTPTIYLRAIYKDGNNLKNLEIRKTEENLVVIERWYPRRNTCVFVGNLGGTPITTDLSAMFYGGTVVAATNISLVGQIVYFDKITFEPWSAIILKMEK